MVFRYACLLLLPLILAACSSNDLPGSPVDPNGEDPVEVQQPDTIKIECEPDSLGARWQLTGPDDFQLLGCASRTLTDMPVGQYTLTWLKTNGWISPDTGPRTLDLAAGEHLSYSGIYEVDPTPDPLKILFIGSSYFGYHNVHLQFQEFAQLAGKDVEVHERIRGGYLLANHLADPVSLDKINEQPWDYVLLQGGSIPLSKPEWHFRVIPFISQMCDTIRANCLSSRIIFMMPWAFESGLLWMEGETDRWRTQADNLYTYTLQMIDDLDIGTAPVGWAWRMIRDSEFPQRLFHVDGNHPSRVGSYLTTCVFYSAVFQEPVTGLAHYDEMNEENAGTLQELATDMVLNDLDLWNLICSP